MRETSLQEEARQGSSESPPLVSPRIRRSERARKRCRRPPLCLLSRRANANGKLEWRWQRCVRKLSSTIRTYACSSCLDAESTTDHSHQDHRDSRRHQAQPSQRLSTSKSWDDAAMTAEVEVGKELSFSTDMNETVLERFAHLEGKLKAVEEENKSLCCGSPDSRLSHRLWKPPEILVSSSLKETIKNTRFYTGLPAIGVFLALTKYLKKKAIRLRQWRGETETGEKYSPRGQKPWKTFPVEEQFFAVLVHARLRLGLKAEDVCDRTGLAPSTFSEMFATLVVFFFFFCIEAASFVSMAK